MALTRITKGVIKPNENYDTHNINSTGIVTAIGLDINGNGDISGNLSVGGVLSYEDVTSIDSVGLITARDGVFIPDNEKLELGNIAGSGDLQLYHTPSNSFIKNNTGTLNIQSDTVRLTDAGLAHVYVKGTASATELYHDNNLRLTTTDDGVDIGGTGSLKLPSGTTAQRNSSPTNGDLRYNTTTDGFEGYTDGDWGPIGGVGAGGTWSTYTAGIATTKSVGVNTSTLDDNDLVGVGNSFQGLYVSNGMIINDNKLTGNHYIGTAFNGMMAGPVTVEGTLTVDGNYVVV